MRLWFVLPVRVPPPNDGNMPTVSSILRVPPPNDGKVVGGLWLVVGGGGEWVGKSAVHSYLRYILTAGMLRNSMAAGIAVYFFTLDS